MPFFERIDPSIRLIIYFGLPLAMGILLGFSPLINTLMMISLYLVYQSVPEIWYLIHQRPIDNYLPALKAILSRPEFTTGSKFSS